MAGLRHDFALALRQLRRAPGYTALVVVTLALGIGGTSSMFRLLDAYVLRPLPFPESEALVRVLPKRFVTAQQVEALREQMTSYRALGAMAQGSVVLEQDGRMQGVYAAVVDAEHFEAFAVRPQLGRAFTADDSVAGAAPAAILSYELWQRAFGGRTDVIGSEVQMAGEGENRRLVVGVMPPGYRPMFVPADVFVSMSYDAESDAYEEMARYWLIGRLADGVGAEAAGAEAVSVVSALAAERQLFTEDDANTAGVVNYQADWIGDFASRLWLLLAAVAAVLLVACTNVAHLISARMSGRERELSIRSALGAERGTLLRQLLVEAGVLTALGGALGLGLATVGLRIAASRLPTSLPSVEAGGVDARTILLTSGVSLVAALLVGFAPALIGSRSGGGALAQPLVAGGRGSGPSRASRRASGALVAVEVALCTALLICAGLLVESLRRISEVDPGFAMEQAHSMTVRPLESHYPDEPARQRAMVEIEETAAGVAGVAAVGSTNILPLTRGVMGVGVSPDGNPVPDGDAPLLVSYRSVTPGFRATLGIPLLEGRDLAGSDRADGEPVGLINRSLAETMFPDRSPIGEQLKWDTGDPWLTVVGVIGDVHQRALDLDPQGEVYVPYAQEAWIQALTLVVRSRGEAEVQAAVHDELARAFPNVLLGSPLALTEVRARSTATPRMYSNIYGAFALLGLLLAALGVYGVTSHAVGRRMHEMGVRFALGAQGGDLIRQVVLSGMRPVVVGLMAGIALALALARLLESQLFGVSASEPGVLVAVTVLLAAVAAAANLVPALRAARVDPVRTLTVE